METTFEIRWHGRGGQGSFMASKLLGIAVSLYGSNHALAFPSFGPERRGAPVQAFNKISKTNITDRSEVRQCDYIVILDETLFSNTYIADLKPGGKIILNTDQPERYSKYGSSSICMTDATSKALEILGRPIANTAMLGALIGISGITTLQSIEQGLEVYFKGSSLEKNRAVVAQMFHENNIAVP